MAFGVALVYFFIAEFSRGFLKVHGYCFHTGGIIKALARDNFDDKSINQLLCTSRLHRRRLVSCQ